MPSVLSSSEASIRDWKTPKCLRSWKAAGGYQEQTHDVLSRTSRHGLDVMAPNAP